MIQSIGNTMSELCIFMIANATCTKLLIKLQETNFLLWKQSVEGVILSHELHGEVVNPHIPSMFKNEQDRIANIISEDYETWIVQDQTLLTWLLSTISKTVLPRVLAHTKHVDLAIHFDRNGDCGSSKALHTACTRSSSNY